MSWGEFAQVMTAFGVVFNVIWTALNGYRSRKRTENLAEKMEVIHKATNGMSEKLQIMAEAKGEAKGVIKGRAREKKHPT